MRPRGSPRLVESVEYTVSMQDLISQATPKSPDSSARRRTVREFHSWLEEFTQYSDSMPLLSDEAISRETIYRDRD